jgi:outer membrane receptor protein involved in Fe transport
MKKLLLMALCCYLSAAALAQTTPQTITVKGTAIDSATNKPMGYVTVSLQDVATKKSVKGGLTKDDGTFELRGVAGKNYQIALASVGYAPKVVKVTCNSAEINLGNIIIKPGKNQLNEVSITAVKPLVKQEIDRISYDVQADPETKTQNVLDMLRKVPLVTIDANDNIQLKGNSDYKILINGKPSSLVAHNPSDVFKSMPASSIQKIEIITTPPAKYDAEGLAGIINIITNKKIDQGYNGSVNMRYNSTYGPGGGLNLTVKQGKLGLSMYAGGSDRIRTYGNSNSTLQTLDPADLTKQTFLKQSSTNVNYGHFLYSSVELSYEIDSLNLITGTMDFNGGHFDSENDQFSQLFDNSGALIQNYKQNNVGRSTSHGVDFGLNYQLGFKSNKNRLLTLSYKYSNSPNNSDNYNTIFDRLNYTQPSFMQQNDAGTREQTIQADYVHPIKKLNIEGGVKVILRDNSSNYENSNLIDSTQIYVVDPKSVDDFSYHQDVYSFYNTYQLSLANWGFKAGLRAERTVIDAHFATGTGDDADQAYNNFIPSVSVQRKFKNGTSLNFGFTNRIQRPNINQLNPFVNTTNTKFIITGNPNLRPVLNHSFEFNYSKFSKGSLNLGLTYSFANNTIQNVTRLLDTGSTFTTYQNLGSNKNLGLNASVSYPITKKININLNSQISQVWLRGYFNSQLYNNSGFQGYMFAYAGYKISDTWRAGINGGFYSANVLLQGKSNASIFTSLSASKDVLKKKGSLFFGANNPFSKYRSYKSTTRDPAFYQTSSSQNPFRSFNIGFNYRFGKLKDDIKKNKRGINNDDTKGTTQPAAGN